jgi:hypothetical protein
MFASNTYAIRIATTDDEVVLRRLAALDSQPALTGPAIIGEIDGRAAAAMSLADGRLVADPFVPTANLQAHLRVRAGALLAVDRTPSLRDRLRAGLQPRLAPRPQA